MKAWTFAFGTLCMAAMLTAACGGSGGAPSFGAGDGGRTDATLVDASGLNAGEGGACHPLSCAKLGYTCGKTGDGCGGTIDCGSCKSPETCGGGGKFSVCGGEGPCKPKTCADLGANCGPAGRRLRQPAPVRHLQGARHLRRRRQAERLRDERPGSPRRGARGGCLRPGDLCKPGHQLRPRRGRMRQPHRVVRPPLHDAGDVRRRRRPTASAGKVRRCVPQTCSSLQLELRSRRRRLRQASSRRAAPAARPISAAEAASPGSAATFHRATNLCPYQNDLRRRRTTTLSARWSPARSHLHPFGQAPTRSRT